jgi:hypothetical protein
VGDHMRIPAVVCFLGDFYILYYLFFSGVSTTTPITKYIYSTVDSCYGVVWDVWLIVLVAGILRLRIV